jgi:hypothetical protein
MMGDFQPFIVEKGQGAGLKDAQISITGKTNGKPHLNSGGPINKPAKTTVSSIKQQINQLQNS